MALKCQDLETNGIENETLECKNNKKNDFFFT